MREKFKKLIIPTVTSIPMIGLATSCANPIPTVNPTPGLTTIKNLIASAFLACGRVSYVWGGGWNTAQTGGNEASTHIGFYNQWEKFFNEQDANYDVSNHFFEQYNGLDCSGFISWVVYNFWNTESNGVSFVGSSTKMAERFANEYGWGEIVVHSSEITQFKPGSIVSMSGHVYMSLGSCNDGSLLLIHSQGAGVHLTGTTTPSGDYQSEAIELASTYMAKYYPKWHEKYASRGYSTSFSYYTYGAKEMVWDIYDQTDKDDWPNLPTSDPENIQNKKAEEVLKIIFNEK